MEENKKDSLVTLCSRAAISIDGVTDILSFDERELLVETVLGRLSIEGEGLHVTVLSVEEGRVALNGRIDGVNYLTDREKKSGRRFGKRS